MCLLYTFAPLARWEPPAGKDDKENQLSEREGKREGEGEGEREREGEGEFACVREIECRDRSSREKLI